MKRLVTSITFAAMVLIPATASAQLWGESLNESPLTPIPEQMTLEEYKNMNRRL
ncbi:MAG: hypothetical protein HOE86_26160, partial [Gemmatimonadetes bacterium]|nr:hypothetical protein [Gemmatimonadota bacterium]